MLACGTSLSTSQNSLLKTAPQEVEVTIAAGATSGTATLGTTVDKNKSIIMWHGGRTPTNCNDQAQIATRIELTDGSTVTAYVQAASAVAAARIVRGVVVEFFPWVIEGNVLHGTVSIPSGSTTVNGGTGNYVTAGNSAREFRQYLGATTDATGDSKRLNTAFATISGVISGSASVQAQKGTTTGNMVVGFCQWIFAQGVLATRQTMTGGALIAGETTVAVGLSGGTANILANCLTFWAGTRYTDGFTENNVYLRQSALNQITLTRVSSSSACAVNAIVAEFLPKWVKSGKQAAQSEFAANQINRDVTVTTLDPKSVLNYLHFTTDNAFGNIEYVMNTVKTENATTIRHERGTGSDTAGDHTPTCSMEVFGFI